MIEAEEVSIEVVSKDEADTAEEADMEEQEEEVGEEDINRAEGNMIDHWIEGLLRREDVDVRKNVLWALRGLKRERRKKCMLSMKRVLKEKKRKRLILWLL